MLKSLIGAALLGVAAQAAQEIQIAAKLVVTEKASKYLADCAVGCAECREAYMDDKPEEIFGACTNWVEYRYSNPC